MKKLILLSISAIALTFVGAGCAGGAGGAGGNGGNSAAGATSTGSIRAQPHSSVGVGTNTSSR